MVRTSLLLVFSHERDASVWVAVRHMIMAVHDVVLVLLSGHAPLSLHSYLSLSLAKSDWRVLFSSRHLHLNLQNIRTINGFEGRLAIIVV